jgi:hypothetical protein
MVQLKSESGVRRRNGWNSCELGGGKVKLPDRPLAITETRSRSYFEFKGTFTFHLYPQPYISFIRVSFLTVPFLSESSFYDLFCVTFLKPKWLKWLLHWLWFSISPLTYYIKILDENFIQNVSGFQCILKMWNIHNRRLLTRLSSESVLIWFKCLQYLTIWSRSSSK